MKSLCWKRSSDYPTPSVNSGSQRQGEVALLETRASQCIGTRTVANFPATG
ncbi:hypothetical protein [Iningainema tapete]|uniref:hypothetical protein n=1 Tax=Iningainema tapete TaxID=2806730 RepID=UPI003B58B02F